MLEVVPGASVSAEMLKFDDVVPAVIPTELGADKSWGLSLTIVTKRAVGSGAEESVTVQLTLIPDPIVVDWQVKLLTD